MLILDIVWFINVSLLILTPRKELFQLFLFLNFTGKSRSTKFNIGLHTSDAEFQTGIPADAERK